MHNHLAAATVLGVILIALSTPVALRAQDDSNVTAAAQDARPPSRPTGDVIDILVPTPDAPYDPGAQAECEREQSAASISREIVVCAPPRDDRPFRTTDDSRKRYAEETAFAGDPQAPDVAGEGIFRGPATLSGMCFIPPCPPPKAIIIDVAALPQAPPGSDADRIARGLPPLGDANPVGDAIVIPTNEAEAARPAATGPVIDYTTPSLDEGSVP